MGEEPRNGLDRGILWDRRNGGGRRSGRVTMETEDIGVGQCLECSGRTRVGRCDSRTQE